MSRPLNAIERREVEARFILLTEKHGWGIANQVISLLRSVYRRSCVDHEGLRNPVDLWLAAGGRFNPVIRRVIYAPISRAGGKKFWFHGFRNCLITIADRELMLPRSCIGQESDVDYPSCSPRGTTGCSTPRCRSRFTEWADDGARTAQAKPMQCSGTRAPGV